MKFAFMDIKKVYTYIEKNGDSGNLNVNIVHDSGGEYLQFDFYTLAGEHVIIRLPEADTGLHTKLTTTRSLL